jgi:anti-anti-sigma factor
MDPWLPPVSIVERHPGVFSIFGEIDMAAGHQLDELDDVHGPLLLDLHGVTFLDSSGAAALVRLYQRCPRADCTLQLERCSPQVERVLRILNLYEILTAPGAGLSTNGDGRGTDLRPSAPEVEPGAAASD